MHSSLIIQEYNFPNTKKESIRWHGKEYFNNQFCKPEISGIYEVLLHHESQYRTLIEMKSFIPIVYYDRNKDIWIHMNSQINVPDIKIIGWRLYE